MVLDVRPDREVNQEVCFPVGVNVLTLRAFDVRCNENKALSFSRW